MQVLGYRARGGLIIVVYSHGLALLQNFAASSEEHLGYISTYSVNIGYIQKKSAITQLSIDT